MKKIYSLVLMAAALLIGTNVWATTVAKIGTTEYESFEDAWKAVKTGETIQLQENITIGTTLWLGTTDMADANPLSITLDLNGDTLTSTALKVFVLSHGSLTVTGEGGIKHAPTTNTCTGENSGYLSAYEVFRVYGSTYKEEANYTHLTIGENVKLIAAVNGIVVDQFSTFEVAKKTGYYAKWQLSSAWAAGNKDIPSTNVVYTNVYASGTGVAHGVCIDVKGTIEARKYAIKANGNLSSPEMYKNKIGTTVSGKYSDRNNTPYVIAAGDEKNYSPFIHIYNGAKLLTTSTTSTEAVAAYGGGYARWLVEGSVTGSTAVYVKSGEIELKNAQITSNFNGTASGSTADRKSGVDAGGSGLVIESSAHYAGGTDVTIEGNTVITPTSGYALEEKITDAADTTKVDNVTIQGGTFKEGDAGTIVVTTQTAGTGGSSSSVSIDGGTFEYANETGGGIDLGGKSLEQFLVDQAGSGDNTHTVVVATDDQGHQTIVISEGDKPAVANSVIGAAENASINWKNDGTTTETLTADKKLTELQISQDYNQTLIVPDGLTLEVGRVVLGAKAQIIVEAGGKFVVTGEQGLAAFQESNLVLKNEPNKRSIFLFHPAVTSNTHPMAIFELLTNSWRDVSKTPNAQPEVFAVPTHTAITNIACKEAGKYAYVQAYTNGGWENIAFTDDANFPKEKLNQPFAAYAVTAYRTEAQDPLTIQLSGELVGNSNATLVADWKWSFFANSYTAEIDLAEFLEGLNITANSVYPAVYVSTVEGNGYWHWRSIDSEKLGDEGVQTKLQPMQGFLLNNRGNVVENNAINYETMVYAPAVPGYVPANPAPRRRANASNITSKLYVNVSNEEGSMDEVTLRETENTKSIEKYMNVDMNIYAMTEEKSAIYAAEDLANTYLGFSTLNGGNFTISFTNVQGREFMLIDHETGAQVLAVEGNTYEFTAAANSTNDYRFEIVEPAKLPTAIENTEAVKSAKGIYTITGQYMGEMNVWNSLPAGVYVVNGEKRVK